MYKTLWSDVFWESDVVTSSSQMKTLAPELRRMEFSLLLLVHDAGAGFPKYLPRFVTFYMALTSRFTFEHWIYTMKREYD